MELAPTSILKIETGRFEVTGPTYLDHFSYRRRIGVDREEQRLNGLHRLRYWTCLHHKIWGDGRITFVNGRLACSAPSGQKIGCLITFSGARPPSILILAKGLLRFMMPPDCILILVTSVITRVLTKDKRNHAGEAYFLPAWRRIRGCGCALLEMHIRDQRVDIEARIVTAYIKPNVFPCTGLRGWQIFQPCCSLGSNSKR
jgi:hypothetical protein